ncbi:MAG: PH domain-containing protein [Phycisphaerales bacterium]|nr:PH domain-containing protein [Planctomycetota bacterium]
MQSTDPRTISRPDPALFKYYFIVSLCSLLGFPVVFLLSWIRYETLRYRFDDDGVWMAWGILFRKEVTLTYRRIQDIHVTRNIIHRWLGLSSVNIQTAAGGALPQMTIEGVREADGLRDFLYEKMRGSKGETTPAARPAEHAEPVDEALELLRDLRRSVDELADRLEGRIPPKGERP